MACHAGDFALGVAGVEQSEELGAAAVVEPFVVKEPWGSRCSRDEGFEFRAVTFQIDAPTTIQFDCPRCTGNVVVTAYGGSYPDLVINKIGAYSGTVLVDSPALYLDVQVSDNDNSPPWSLTVK